MARSKLKEIKKQDEYVKEVARHLEHEYVAMLAAACESKHHPRARLRAEVRLP